MPDFVVGLLVGMPIGSVLGIITMCLVQAHKLDVPKDTTNHKSTEQGENADEF